VARAGLREPPIREFATFGQPDKTPHCIQDGKLSRASAWPSPILPSSRSAKVVPDFACSANVAMLSFGHAIGVGGMIREPLACEVHRVFP
jgi:hypothetical protein